MSIYYSGTFTRSSGVVSAICKQLKLMNLKNVKKIQVQFDPFHHNAVTASPRASVYIQKAKLDVRSILIKTWIIFREFLFHISTPQVIDTNLNCAIRTNVVCDRSEPQITVDLTDKKSVKFLANNLTVLEILQKFNEHISSKVKEDPVAKELSVVKETKKKKR